MNRHPDQEAGRIPFRLRIGVTGHRELPDQDKLAGVVRGQIERLIGLLQKRASTIIELAVISQLADGADRLVVHQVLDVAAERGQEARLEVVLPMRRADYIQAQKFGPDSVNEFNKLLEQASLVSEPGRASNSHNRHPSYAYEAAGRELIASCDILLALWDGQPTGGTGGPADTLRAAAATGKPCVWIPTDPAEPVTDNLSYSTSYDFYRQVAERPGVPGEPAGRSRAQKELPEDVLEPLYNSRTFLERYNRERRPPKFDQRLRKEFNFPGGEEDWVAPFFLRATMLAAKNQTHFVWSARAITLLAIVAATVLGVHLGLSSSPVWGWAEVASLVAILVIFYGVRRYEFHDRWITYRFLAEWLRSARFLIPAGVSYGQLKTTVTAHMTQHPSDWIQRAFDGFWEDDRCRGKRNENAPKTDEEAMRRRLADEWIGKQITYHQQRSWQHHLWQRILLNTTLILFVGALTCAILDAADVYRNVTGCLSVVFPAGAASLGALLTIRQHQQLAERSDKMLKDLADARWEIMTLASPGMMISTALQAATIMAVESEGWLDALWFLDVEHPG